LADDDESKLLLTGLSFGDLSKEAEGAINYDQLTESDFFGRLRLFKESISELFYAPSVTAAAIESNIAIGNAFVRLIRAERKKLDSMNIESKYGGLDVQGVSDTTGRTLDVAELARVREKEETAEKEDAIQPTVRRGPVKGTVVVEQSTESKRSPLVANVVESTRHINRWLVVAGVLVFCLTLALYLWADFFVAEKVSTIGVRQVNVDHTSIGEYIQTARISNETYYGLMLPVWDTLPKDRREEVLKKIFDDGKDKGYRQVSLINKEGKQAGFASADRMDAMMP
jgi:hypothetical protein